MTNIKPQLLDNELDLLNSSAEAKFYRACRTLPSNWLVLFSVPWIGTTFSGRKYDGEADFVIFAPNYGMLVIEVKGGRVESEPSSGKWYSTDRTQKKHIIKNPYEQAKKEKHALLKILNSDSRLNIYPKKLILSGHAVFFPDCDSVCGSESLNKLSGFANDLNGLEEWVIRVFNYWGGECTSWKPLLSEVCTLDKIFSSPIFVKPLLSTVLKEEENQRIKLTENQSRVLRAISNRSRAIVYGGAGTGKTLLALEQAQYLSSSGKKTLLVCYNRMLADFFNIFCESDPLIQAMSFHQLCDFRARQVWDQTGKDLLEEMKIEFLGEDFFKTQMPAALLYSTDILEEKYDAIVVDEGQDFNENYWESLTYLFKDENNSVFFVFLDPNQAIYKVEYDRMPIKEEPFHLTINCRNTKHIHEASYQFYKGVVTDPPLGNDGEPVQLLKSHTIKKQALAIYNSIIEKLSEGVLDEQIAVLILSTDKKRLYQELENYKLPHNLRWNIEGSIIETGIRVDTVSRFKGLESDIVYLWGINDYLLTHNKELLYVGMSRAKSRLILVGTDEDCKACLGI